MGLDVMSGPRENNRAIGCVGVSTGSQEEDGSSLAQQTRRIQKVRRVRGARGSAAGTSSMRGAMCSSIPIYDSPSGACSSRGVESGRYAHVISTMVDWGCSGTWPTRSPPSTTSNPRDLHPPPRLPGAGAGHRLGDRQEPAAGRGRLRRDGGGLISERTRYGMAYLRQNLLRFTRSLYGWNVTDGNRLVPSGTSRTRSTTCTGRWRLVASRPPPWRGRSTPVA